MEQLHDYRMVDGHSIVEHDKVAKETKNFGCMMPDKFMVGCIIAKLP